MNPKTCFADKQRMNDVISVALVKRYIPTATSRDRIYSSFLIAGIIVFIGAGLYSLLAYAHQSSIREQGEALYPKVTLKIKNSFSGEVLEIDEVNLPGHVSNGDYLIPLKDYEFKNLDGDLYLVGAQGFRQALDSNWVHQSYEEKRDRHYLKNLKYEFLELSILITALSVVYVVGIMLVRHWVLWVRRA